MQERVDQRLTIDSSKWHFKCVVKACLQISRLSGSSRVCFLIFTLCRIFTQSKVKPTDGHSFHRINKNARARRTVNIKNHLCILEFKVKAYTECVNDALKKFTILIQRRRPTSGEKAAVVTKEENWFRPEAFVDI